MDFGVRKNMYSLVRESLHAAIQRLTQSELSAVNDGITVWYHHESGEIEIVPGVDPHDPARNGSAYYQRRDGWYSDGYDASETIDPPHEVKAWLLGEVEYLSEKLVDKALDDAA